jgi:hypothetical protein
MSQATGLPASVITAQAWDESSYNPTAVSPAGAKGWLQFLPSTYQGYATKAGVSPNSEFDPASEAKVYDLYMSDLLNQEGGNVAKALAAYNAGPANIGAGAGYAQQILNQAGASKNLTASPGQNASLTSFNPLNPLGSLTGGISISGVLGNLFGDMRDMLERFGLILLGAAVVLLGIHILANGGGGGGTTVQVNQPSGGKSGAKEVKSGSKEASGLSKGTGATEAIETAAVA